MMPGAEAVTVFHAFIKKAQKTPLNKIRIAKKRLKEIHDEKT
jgi:phage-related protein